MDFSYATLRCTVELDHLCGACKGHLNEIISSIIGKYDLTMDGARGTATIIGQVDPTYCMKAIARCRNGHAKLLWANLSHPRMGERSYGYDYETSSYYDGIPYGSRRSLPMPGMYHGYHTPAPIAEYSYNNGYDYETSLYYDGIPYGSRRSLPMPGMYHGYPTPAPIPEYSYNNGYDYYGHNPIYRRSNPTIPYDPDQEYSSSFCTIM